MANIACFYGRNLPTTTSRDAIAPEARLNASVVETEVNTHVGQFDCRG